jgi:hypothetical protein
LRKSATKLRMLSAPRRLALGGRDDRDEEILERRRLGVHLEERPAAATTCAASRRWTGSGIADDDGERAAGMAVGRDAVDARDARQRGERGRHQLGRAVDAHAHVARRPRAGARGPRACPPPGGARGRGSGCASRGRSPPRGCASTGSTVRPESPRRSPRISTVCTGSSRPSARRARRSGGSPTSACARTDALAVALRELAGELPRDVGPARSAPSRPTPQRVGPRRRAPSPPRRTRGSAARSARVEAHLLRAGSRSAPGRERPVRHVDAADRHAPAVGDR